MPVEFIDFIVEEYSMELFLSAFLPRVIGGISYQIHTHQCKDDLLSKLESRFRGYAHWLPENYRIVVLIDRDNDDCRELKQRLVQMAENAGLRHKSAGGHDYQVAFRVVIEELEAWYFGDWQAVREAYPRVSPEVVGKAAYRNSDGIAGGTWEAFERELQRYGYFSGGLRKAEAAAEIGAVVQSDRSSSHSFRVFVDLLRSWAQAGPPNMANVV